MSRDPATPYRGSDLIFLVSQPRAGSTLLQRILASHSAIHTASEPWLLLPLLYPLGNPPPGAPYDGDYCERARREFVKGLPGTDGDYLEAIRRMYGYLYRRHRQSSAKDFFLDKTPRYYWILPELLTVFPESRMILMLRNPLAVLSSILKTWTRGRLSALAHFGHDLLEAPKKMAAILDRDPEALVTVRFESLVTEPRPTLKNLCDELSLEYEEQMLEYGTSDLPRWPLGDQRRVYDAPAPEASVVDHWRRGLADPVVWRLSREYLDELGPELLHRLGYSYAELEAILEETRPSLLRRLGIRRGHLRRLAAFTGQPSGFLRNRP